MAQVKAAKESLEKAIIDYDCAKGCITKEMAKTTPNQRMLTNKWNRFDAALKELNHAHSTWLSRANLSDEALENESQSVKWLEEVWDGF